MGFGYWSVKAKNDLHELQNVRVKLCLIGLGIAARGHPMHYVMLARVRFAGRRASLLVGVVRMGWEAGRTLESQA